MSPNNPRARARSVSPERIAKVAAALEKKTSISGVELRPDGSVVILTGLGSMPLTVNQGNGGNEWDEVLTAAA